MEGAIILTYVALFALSAQPLRASAPGQQSASERPVQRTSPAVEQNKVAEGVEVAPDSRPNLAGLFSTDDYPKEAWLKGEQGMVDVTLTVGVDGKVADCVVNHSSGSPSLDVQTCRVLWTRARFIPARDSQGKPVQDSYRQRIRWELPAPEPADVTEEYARHIITVDASKAIVGCRYESSPDWESTDSHCAEALEQMRQFVSTAPDWIEFAGSELVVETQHRVGEAQGGIELGERPGESMLALSRLYLTIDAAGKIKSCSRDSWGAARGDPITCELANARWIFEALPAQETNKNDRQLTVVNAIYLRKTATSQPSDLGH